MQKIVTVFAKKLGGRFGRVLRVGGKRASVNSQGSVFLPGWTAWAQFNDQHSHININDGHYGERVVQDRYSLQPVRGTNWHVSTGCSKASVDKIRTNGLAAQLRPRFDHVLVIFTFAPHAFAAMQTMRDSSACSADVQPANISPQLTALSHDHSTHRLLALWRRRTTGTRFKRNSNA